MRMVIIDNKFTWKLTQTTNGFTGKCGRLNLILEAPSLQEFIDIATKTMYDLFQDKFKTGQLNDFSFNHATAYRVETFNGFLDLSIPLILED